MARQVAECSVHGAELIADEKVAEVNSTKKSLLIKRILQGRFLQGHAHLMKEIRMITQFIFIMMC